MSKRQYLARQRAALQAEITAIVGTIDAGWERGENGTASCASRRYIDWTPESRKMPDNHQTVEKICQHCPVKRACAIAALSDVENLLGWRAGVWCGTGISLDGPEDGRESLKRRKLKKAAIARLVAIATADEDEQALFPDPALPDAS